MGCGFDRSYDRVRCCTSGGVDELALFIDSESHFFQCLSKDRLGESRDAPAVHGVRVCADAAVDVFEWGGRREAGLADVECVDLPAVCKCFYVLFFIF